MDKLTEKSTLLLRSVNLNLNESNARGDVNQFRTSITWNNINLRTVLGDMYDKYETFNIELKEMVQHQIIENVGINPKEENVLVYVSGLNWLNNSYDIHAYGNKSEVCFGSFDFGPQNAKTQGSNSKSNMGIATFAKNQEALNLKIEYRAVHDNNLPITSVAFPQVAFLFNIYGVKLNVR